MGTWFRGIRTGVVALSIGGLLAGCGSDGRGLSFFFGVNGNGNCSTLVVDVDLDAAGALLDEKGGAVDCVLSSLLENRGCDVTFTEIQGGDVLRVTISGCTIPAVASLFECGFKDADLSELADQVEAQCTCSSQGCDTTPPVCVSEDSDPGSCEDCNNGQDDDGNGDTDCDDANCQYSPLCEPVTTTTTTTSTTTTTTTTLPPTGCTVVFRLADDVTLGSLQWTTTYDGSVEPEGSGAAVACTSLIDGALAAFNDIEAQNRLESGLVSLDGINGPINVASCTVDTIGGASAADFTISDVEAATVDLEVVTPAPDVVIGSVLCGGDTTTTTTSSSSTTTIDTTTTTGEPASAYSVLFKLDSASTSLGALQFSVNYSGAPGEFRGSGGTVVCTNKVVGALFAPNDNEAANKLSLGIIALSPFSAPGDLVQCTFDATDVPVPGDFPITIEDATDSDGAPATAEISVAVTPL